MIARRFGQWVHEFRFEVKPLDERFRSMGLAGDAKQFYLIKDVFTMRDGDWRNDSRDVVGSTEAWARDQYLSDWNQTFVADVIDQHPHVFTRVETASGLPIRNKQVMAWTGSFERVFESDFQGYLDVEVDPTSGWGWLEMPESSMYDPALEQGPWCIKPRGFAESIEGVGLPSMLGISTFIVWVELPISEYRTLQPAFVGGAHRAAEAPDDFAARLADMARVNQVVFFNREATIQQRIIKDGFVPCSGEFEVEHGADRYVAQLAESLQTGEQRAYYIKRNLWHQVHWLPVGAE